MATGNNVALELALDWKYLHQYLLKQEWDHDHQCYIRAACKGDPNNHMPTICRQNRSWEAWILYSEFKSHNY